MIKKFIKLTILGAFGIWVVFTAWLNTANPFVIGSIGFSVGIFLLLAFIRFLGKRAYKSMLLGDIFSLFTGYKIQAYIHKNTLVDKEDKIELRQDTNNIMLILTRELNFTKKEATLRGRRERGETSSRDGRNEFSRRKKTSIRELKSLTRKRRLLQTEKGW